MCINTGKVSQGAVLRVKEIRDPRILPSLRQEWSDLQARAPETDPFQSYDWVSLWLRSYWADRPIRILFLWQGASLIGIVPFLVEESSQIWCRGSLVHKARLLHAGDTAQVMAAILNHFCDNSGPVRIAFIGIPRDALMLKCLHRPARRYRLGQVCLSGSRSPIVTIQTDWDTYLQSLSRHVRHEMHRKERRARRQFQIRFLRASVLEDWSRAMRDVLQVERQSWKEGAHISLTAQGPHRRFYMSYTRRCAAAGTLGVYLLYMDSYPVAHIIGVVHRGTYYALRTSYDVRFGAFSPGTILMEYALKDSFARGFSAFHFLGGGSRWKRELATACEEHCHLCLFRKNLLKCKWCMYKCNHFKPFLQRHAPGVIRQYENWRRIALTPVLRPPGDLLG